MRGLNKGDAIVKFLSLVRYGFALVTASLIASCGGGGAETRVIDTGPFAVNPPSASWYAGVMGTLTITGGSPPFQVSSSEPGLLPVPQFTSSRTLDLVPNQPGVVDAGLPPDALPIRTVNIVVRSAEGNSATSVIRVGINFLTGYNFTILGGVSGTTCSAGIVCVGGESVIEFDSVFNGNLYKNKQFRIEKIRGPWQFVDPINTNNQVDAVTVTSDEEGKFTTVIRVATGLPAQVAILKITDVQTGAYVFKTFTINTVPSTGQGTLTAIPATVNLTGPNGTTCGFGTTDVLVFDGAPPYTAICPSPQIQVVNPSSTTEPGRFTFNVGASAGGSCLTGELCVITDSKGNRITVPFTTVVGTSPAPTPLAVSPAAITLTCGSTGAVTVVGGTGTYSTNSTSSRVTATASGNSLSISLNLTDATPAPVGGYPTTVSVGVTDGASAATVAVTVPPSCP